MSLDKAIAAGKEHRKPYFHAARFDPACRPGGGCGYCRGNRLHRDIVLKDVVFDALNEGEEKVDPSFWDSEEMYYEDED